MVAVCPPEPDVTPLIDKDAIYREAIHEALERRILGDLKTITIPRQGTGGKGGASYKKEVFL